MNLVINEFNRYALTYHHTNELQKQIASYLLSKVFCVGDSLLDLGCGSGAVYELIEGKCRSFTGIDASEHMCRLHPKKEGVMISCHNFDDENISTLWKENHFDLVVSSSALQWSTNPEHVIENMRRWGRNVGVALFTQKTFSSLHDKVGFVSSLPSKETLEHIFHHTHHEVLHYEKTFPSTRILLEYVKKSGFNGNGHKISPILLKKIIKEDQLKTLEFEVFYGWDKEANSSCSKV